MSRIIRYGVIADTHDLLPPAIFDIFENVQCIYHCGDIGSTICISDLETIAPLRAVRGNMDVGKVAVSYPDQVIEELEFGSLAMVHGMQYGHRNETIIRELLLQFLQTKPRIILFGHSHVPCLEEREGILFLNPGSPTRPKIGNPPSVGLIEYNTMTDELVARHVTVL